MAARRWAGRAVLFVLLIAGFVAAWRWRDACGASGMTVALAGNPLAPLVFIVLHIAGSLFFVPRTLLALGAGIVFGMWWGIVWAAVGSVAGAVAGFLIARYLHAGLAEPAGASRLAAFLRYADRGGWRMVATVRLVPVIPHSLTNYAFGITGVGLGAFAVGSLIGQLPMTVAYADLGAAGGQALLCGANWPHEVLWPSLIGVTALLLSLLIPAVARRRWRQAQPVVGG